MEKVAVVVTVLNEAETIDLLLKSLKIQTLTPRELVVVDGGSTDATLEILNQWTKKWPLLKVYRRPGNRSVCRNFGVKRSSSPIIAFTDAGCIPKPDWLEKLVAPFARESNHVVSGYYDGCASTAFEKCLIPFVLVMPDKAEKKEFLPSARSMAIRRSAWNQTSGFDPSLSHNEDYAFALKLKAMSFNFVFAPKAIVSWLPRKNLLQAAAMFFRFAYGDIQAGIFRPKVKILIARYLLGTFLFFYLWEINRAISVFFVTLALMTYSFWSVAKNYRYVNDLRAFFWLPVLQFTADFSVLLGTATGKLNKIYS